MSPRARHRDTRARPQELDPGAGPAKRVPVSLGAEDLALRDRLAAQLGISGAEVLRRGLRALEREVGGA